MIRYILPLLLAVTPAFAQQPQPDMLQSAAVAIVANTNCNRAVFDDVQVITFLFSGAVQRGMTKDQAVAQTQVLVTQILNSIKTRQELQNFCAAMNTVQGEPT